MVELTTKGHMVTLHEESYDLARHLGLINLSEFVRDSISYFISGSDRELTASEIRDIAKKFALEKRASMMQQQKITGLTELEQKKVRDLKDRRSAAIKGAVQVEIDRIGIDRFRRYMEDPHGDYAKIQDDSLVAISENAGFAVQLSDVVAVMGWRI